MELDFYEFLALISIHAPREGCDVLLCAIPFTTENISIHAPREGCDLNFLF